MMQLCNLADEGEAEPGARRFDVLYTRNPVELFEDAGQVAFRNAIALVSHLDHDGVFFGDGGDRHFGSAGAVLDGVRDQIFERA